LLESELERGQLAEPDVALAFLAGQGIGLDDALLRGARRRALLLLATGGDPRRSLSVEDPAVGSLAAELSAPEPVERLHAGLAALHGLAADLPCVKTALEALLSDRERAWRAYGCALLAEGLAD
jgi:hypothetical protein